MTFNYRTIRTPQTNWIYVTKDRDPGYGCKVFDHIHGGSYQFADAGKALGFIGFMNTRRELEVERMKPEDRPCLGNKEYRLTSRLFLEAVEVACRAIADNINAVKTPYVAALDNSKGEPSSLAVLVSDAITCAHVVKEKAREIAKAEQERVAQVIEVSEPESVECEDDYR